MNVAIIGNGGREHALAIKFNESSLLEKLYVIPGNPGTKNIATNVKVDISNHSEVINFCKEHKISLVVIGPEKPLTQGLTDSLIKNNIHVFGPTKNAARIEGEKSFAKELMKEAKIPTASFKVFSKENYEDALNYLQKVSYPIVIKADGIAAGKGVVIPESFDDAKAAIQECFVNCSFGKAGDKVVIEEFMEGQESSIFAITDGKDYILLPAAQDHKRIHDGDLGKNTGGMGAYAPTPFVDEIILEKVARKIVEPTLLALSTKNSAFVGCLYCGLMMTKHGVKVVEFNCRFGDPETQVVLPLIKGDFLQLLYSCSTGKIEKESVTITKGSSICVVLASKGYPDKAEKGVVINGLENFNHEKTHIIYAGTKEVNNKIVTNGGRVLNLVTTIEENDLKRCKEIIYTAVPKINFSGMQYRKDISDKALLAEK